MCLSIVFIALDLFSVTPVLALGGINPFWKFASVFKCLTDTIILDDFKMALDKLSRHKMSQFYQLPFSNPGNELPTDWMEMNRRGAALTPCHESDVLVSVEQVERVPADATAIISTTDVVPCPPPIALTRNVARYEKGK
jgi:hypothetical protein